MRILLFIFLCISGPLSVSAQNAAPLEALQSADDARVAAMCSADAQKLGDIFSDALRYAHSNGIVDTKASFVDVLLSGKTKYTRIDYQERNFSFPAPGIALMTGRAQVKVSISAAESDVALSFLAVWREENGHWRFLAWQSCRLPSPPAQ